MVDLKKMQSEIDEMEKALEEPGAGDEEFRTDAPGTQAPGTYLTLTHQSKTTLAMILLITTSTYQSSKHGMQEL